MFRKPSRRFFFADDGDDVGGALVAITKGVSLNEPKAVGCRQGKYVRLWVVVMPLVTI
jgi:hypothetical protein